MKKKGFTLVELLAVIVILAIIALITTPIIMNVVESSRKSSATSSAYGYIKGVNITYANELLLGNNFELDGILKVDENGLLENKKVEVEGTTVKGGYLVYEDSKIKEGCLTIGDYKVSIENDEVKTAEKGVCEPIIEQTYKGIAYLDPTDLTKKCNSILASENVNEYGTPTGIKEGCMKWYIYDDEGDKYKMILDHNTTPLVPWNSTDSNAEMKEVKEALESDTSNWDSKITARLITADEIAKITNNINFDSKTSKPYFYLDTNTYKVPSLIKGESKYSWLFNNLSDCTSHGCSIEDNNEYLVFNKQNYTLKVSGYWTQTPIVDSNRTVWNIYSSGTLGDCGVNASHNRGLRPVIEVDKSLLQ